VYCRIAVAVYADIFVAIYPMTPSMFFAPPMDIPPFDRYIVGTVIKTIKTDRQTDKNNKAIYPSHIGRLRMAVKIQRVGVTFFSLSCLSLEDISVMDNLTVDVA